MNTALSAFKAEAWDYMTGADKVTLPSRVTWQRKLQRIYSGIQKTPVVGFL